MKCKQMVCEYCRNSPSTVSPGPCGGPKKYTTKVSCERCHHSKKRCSFNPDPPRRKRKAVDVDDNGEGSSQRSTTQGSTSLGSRLDEGSDDEEVPRKRVRRGKERAVDNEEEALTERLQLAYDGVMEAEVELMRARLALNAYVSRVDKRGL